MKRRIISSIMALVLLAASFGAVVGFTGCNKNSGGGGGGGAKGEPKAPAEVKLFDPNTKNDTGGVITTVYQVVVKSDVDWDKLSESRKRAVIDYAFEAAWYHADENDIVNFNVIGLSDSAEEGGPKTAIFMWDRENNSVVVCISGVPTYYWDAPVRPKK